MPSHGPADIKNGRPTQTEVGKEDRLTTVFQRLTSGRLNRGDRGWDVNVSLPRRDYEIPDPSWRLSAESSGSENQERSVGNTSRTPKERAARLGQRRTVCDAVEQRQSDLRFELLYPVGHGRPCTVQPSPSYSLN